MDKTKIVLKATKRSISHKSKGYCDDKISLLLIALAKETNNCRKPNVSNITLANSMSKDFLHYLNKTAPTPITIIEESEVE